MPLYQEKIKQQDGVPSKFSGSDGEIRIGLYKSSLRMYVKYKNAWHTINFDGVTKNNELVSTNVTLKETTISNQIISNLTVDNIKINNNIIDNGGTGRNASSIILHPEDTTQAHPDYLLNDANDEMRGSLNLRGGGPLGATADYILKCKTYTSGVDSLFVGNNEYQENSSVVYNFKAGFWVAPGDISGRLEVGTASGTNFLIEDDGDVFGQTFNATGTLKGATLTIGATEVIDGSLNIDIGTSAIECGTIDTGGGAFEVYGLVTGTDAADGSVEYVSGSAQGSAAYKFKVGSNKIKDSHLEYNTGQDLSPHTLHSVVSEPNFAMLGIGAAAHASVPLLIESTNELKIQMKDGSALAGIATSNAGDLILQPDGGQDVLIHSSKTLASETYVSGFTGSGWNLSNSGGSTLDVDNLNVRGTMSVYELLIQQIRATNGSVLVGSADKVISIALVDSNEAVTVPNSNFQSHTVIANANDTFLDWYVNSFVSDKIQYFYNTELSQGMMEWEQSGSFRKFSNSYTTLGLIDGNRYRCSLDVYAEYPNEGTNFSSGFYWSQNINGVAQSNQYIPQVQRVAPLSYDSDATSWMKAPNKQTLSFVFTASASSNVLDLQIGHTGANSMGRILVSLVNIMPEYECTIESDFDGTGGTGTDFIHFKTDDLILAQKWSGTSGTPPHTPTTKIEGYVNEVGGINGSLIDENKFRASFSGVADMEATDLPLDFVRVGSVSDSDRQGLVYLTSEDVGAPFIDIVDGVSSWSNWRHSLSSKVRVGKLDGINDPELGALSDYGLYSDNVYLRGKIQATEGYFGSADQGWTITATGLTNAASDSNTNISIGSGGHGASAQKFYIDGAGDFSLGDKLKFTGSTGALELTGVSITITAGDIVGGISASDITDVDTYATNQDLQSLSTLNSDSISGQTGLYMDSSKIGFVDSGTFKTYMDNTGKFILTGSSSDGLNWNPATNILAITGDITVSNTGDFADVNADATGSALQSGVTITGGGITMGAGGSIKGGSTAYNTGDGFFLGYSGSAHKLSIKGTNGGLTFDGDELAITGDVTAVGGNFGGDINLSGTLTMTDGSDIMKIGHNIDGTRDGIYINANNKWFSNGGFMVGDASRYIVHDAVNSQIKIKSDELILGTTDIADPDNMASYINLSTSGVQIGGEHISIDGSTTFSAGTDPNENWIPVWSWMGAGEDGTDVYANMGDSIYPIFGSTKAYYFTDQAYAEGSTNGVVAVFGFDSGSNDECWFDSSGAAGNSVSSSNAWKSARIPYNSNSLYKISIRVKRSLGSGTVFCGIAGYNSSNDGYISSVGTVSYSSQHYFAMNNVALSTEWVTYIGYFSGHSTNSAGGQHNTISDPGAMRTGVQYISPLFIANYDNQSGSTEVDWMKIERSGGQTTIDGDMISTGMIDANRIDVDSIFAIDANVTNVLTMGSGNDQKIKLGNELSIPDGDLTDEDIVIGKIKAPVNGVYQWTRGIWALSGPAIIIPHDNSPTDDDFTLFGTQGLQRRQTPYLPIVAQIPIIGYPLTATNAATNGDGTAGSSYTYQGGIPAWEGGLPYMNMILGMYHLPNHSMLRFTETDITWNFFPTGAMWATNANNLGYRPNLTDGAQLYTTLSHLAVANHPINEYGGYYPGDYNFPMQVTKEKITFIHWGSKYWDRGLISNNDTGVHNLMNVFDIYNDASNDGQVSQGFIPKGTEMMAANGDIMMWFISVNVNVYSGTSGYNLPGGYNSWEEYAYNSGWSGGDVGLLSLFECDQQTPDWNLAANGYNETETNGVNSGITPPTMSNDNVTLYSNNAAASSEKQNNDDPTT